MSKLAVDQNFIPSNRADSFHAGQLWSSTRGTLYRVVLVKNRHATLRAGDDGGGRIIRRQWDAVVNWVLMFDPSPEGEL
jgi:hypothetical protein